MTDAFLIVSVLAFICIAVTSAYYETVPAALFWASAATILFIYLVLK